MAEFTYPSSILDQSDQLLALLGSHWSNVYQGNNLVESYAFARAQEEAQNHLELLEALASLSRFEVPVFHKDNWYFLTIKESEINTELLEYGDGATYGAQVGTGLIYQYGVNFGKDDYRFTTPDNLADASAIYNRVSDPSKTLVKGVDFLIDRGFVVFRDNPFDDEYFIKRNIYTGSDVTDREIGLWVFKGDFDYDHIHNHFGYILSLKLQSSEEYRDLVNGVMDAIVKGTTESDIQLSLAAITGNPIVKESSEVVELIQVDNNNLVIVTDKHSYLYPKTATANVTVGDTVTAGQFMTDTVTFYDLNEGVTDSDIGAVALGAGFLSDEYVGPITFINESVTPTVDTSGTYTRVEFNLGGFPTDIERFWDEVHADGIARGKTLAHLLDTRTNPVGEPGAGDLPSTINPLEFLVTNLLRFHAYIVKIKIDGLRGTIDFNNSRLFRRIVPPWTAMIILIELEESDTFDVDAIITDTLTTFDGAELFEETITLSTLCTETLTAYHVDGLCQ